MSENTSGNKTTSPRTSRRKRKLGIAKRQQLIADILQADHDLVGLGKTHGLSPDDLARWIADADNHDCLLGLCRLADIQTQVLLSRYRLLAANRLIRLATTEDGQVKEDVARRACVDLLRLDLKRAEAMARTDDESTHESPLDLSAFRDLLYGDETTSSEEPNDG